MFHILALDLSTHIGWAYIAQGRLVSSGELHVPSPKTDKKNPQNDPGYPETFNACALHAASLIEGLLEKLPPLTNVVIENTVSGSKSRHDQRILEWIHLRVFEVVKQKVGLDRVKYMDPSEWRSAIAMRMTKEDKKKNQDVKAGKAKGKITSKHLSVRYANENFGLKLLQKENNQADAICLGMGFWEKNRHIHHILREVSS